MRAGDAATRRARVTPVQAQMWRLWTGEGEARRDTLGEIGERFRVTPERVRQVVKQAQAILDAR